MTPACPQSVLVAGKPHLGTDRLVRILKAFRAHLLALGATIRFGAAAEGIIVRGGAAVGVRMQGAPRVGGILAWGRGRMIGSKQCYSFQVLVNAL